MTIWIGLTGGIGSGKSQAAAEFSFLGVPVLDADAVSRELTGENGKALPLIRKCFGESVFMGAQLNRAVMRQLVFADSSARQDLENMMLPLIMEKIQNRQLLYQQQPYGVIEIPLLQEKKEFQTLVQHVLLIDADESEYIVLWLEAICQNQRLEKLLRHRARIAQGIGWLMRLS